MASTFTSDTLPADHKAAIRQMKHALQAGWRRPADL